MGLGSGPESIPQNSEDADLDFTKPKEETPEPKRDWDKEVADPSDLTVRRLDSREK